ncbi:MAG: imidazole glycerol phosphate synthase subunit HisH [Bacteroidales bacterium]|nr:imidazole glycerol phosphate synthase subunit HisH [Bacteroidales bacterium]
MKVVIIDYGAGNIASLTFALERIGVTEIILSNEKETIIGGDKVIFPGVGHASYAMKQLKQYGLEVVIPALKQPVLGICLGMQLMCKATDEGDEQGLGIFDANVKKFEPLLKVPHMGWNMVEWNSPAFGAEMPVADWFYFVHGFYAEITSQTIGRTEYINPISAVLKKDNFVGCQFHPEKSGDSGEQFLKKFLRI